MRRILDRVGLIFAWFGASAPDAAEDLGSRWADAFKIEPDLAVDLIKLGHVLSTEPVQMLEGVSQPVPMDPYRLAYEAGRRDFALTLLALGKLSDHDLNKLMEI